MEARAPSALAPSWQGWGWLWPLHPRPAHPRGLGRQQGHRSSQWAPQDGKSSGTRSPIQRATVNIPQFSKHQAGARLGPPSWAMAPGIPSGVGDGARGLGLVPTPVPPQRPAAPPRDDMLGAQLLLTQHKQEVGQPGPSWHTPAGGQRSCTPPQTPRAPNSHIAAGGVSLA